MEKKYQTYLIAEIIIQALFCNILAGSEAQELEVKIERNVPVKMRDGVILRADVYRPDRGGPYPVLVQRTPYGKDRNFDDFVKAGYIVVSQDVRGRYESEGKSGGLWRGETQAEDGYDTVEWAAKLPGSNGKVGTFGGSALAGVQWRLAPLRPPSLVAMSANAIAAQHTYYRRNGAILPSELRVWVVSFSPEMRRRANRPGVHTVWEAGRLWNGGELEKWYNFLPRLELPEEIFEDETKIMKDYMENPHYDPLRLDEGCREISVPNLEFSGLYDMSNGNMLMYRTMAKEAKTEIARKGSRIIIGPWGHLSYASRYGNIDFGPDAALDEIAVQILWFDYWLKGKPNGVDKDPPVKIFVMGDNKWRDEQHWPLQRTKDKVLYITSAGHANTPEGDGKLVEKECASSDADKYTYDPNDPVPNPGGRRLIPADQRQLAHRKDILVYQTEPLTKRIEVTGNPVVELYASSSAPDTDWFVRLIDVYPDGLALNVAQGTIRARYRNGLDKPELIKPGEIVKYTITMMPTSNAFLPEHRIRLDITSSDFPNYDRNHNTAADQNADATLVTAKQTVYHGGKQATRIILPWAPNPIEEKPTEEQKPKHEPEKRMYPLHQAAADGDIERVRSLISNGADINAENEKKRTPLHYADDTAIAEYLIAHGANVNPDNGWTPLQQAPYSGSIEMVELLITKGADINAGPWTALQGAVDEGRWDIARLLIDKGADIQSMIPKGLTLLHYMSSYDSRDIVEGLLAKGAKVNEEDDVYKFTALHYAARFGSKNVAEVLIANGADIRAKDKWDYQPIHVAAHHDRADVVELLISKGADINAKTSLDQTPIQLAQARRNTKTIELLRKHGAKE